MPKSFIKGPDSDPGSTTHCKKRLAIFPSPAGMSLNKLSLAGNNLIIPRRVCLVTSRLGTGKSLIFFYSAVTTLYLSTLSFLIWLRQFLQATELVFILLYFGKNCQVFFVLLCRLSPISGRCRAWAARRNMFAVLWRCWTHLIAEPWDAITKRKYVFFSHVTKPLSVTLRPNSWTQVLRVFILACYYSQSHVLTNLLTPSPPPLLEQEWLETGL